jgi:hypothetical protein
MTTFRAMISNNTGVSSNRFINVLMVVFMLLVMIYAIFIPVDIETLKLVLEYSLYIFISSLGTKSVEKITALIKSKSGQ